MRLLALLAVTALSCAGNRASIEIEDARASWVNLAVTRHVYVDVDLLAHDQLGGNIGWYCATLRIPGQNDVIVCDDDLSDGDRKTLRLESASDVGDAVPINISVRHAGVGVGRDLVGPVPL